MNNEQRRFLLIEADPIYARLVQDHLTEIRNVNSTVHCVKSLAEGIAVLNKGGFDVVLLSLNLCDIEGNIMMQAFIDANPSIPIILLMGSNDEGINHSALRRYIDDFLVKEELTAGLLSHSIRYATERRQLQQELKETNQELQNIVQSFHNLIAVQAEGILIVDEDQKIKYANPIAQDILDLPIDVLRENYFNYQVGVGHVVEFEIARKGHPTCIAEFRATNLIWDGKNSHLISIRDVTSQKLAENALLLKK